jgi:hypothetical protein
LEKDYPLELVFCAGIFLGKIGIDGCFKTLEEEGSSRVDVAAN